MQEAAVEAFRVLKLRDYGRVYLRLRTSGERKRKAGRKGSGNGPNAASPDWEFHVIEVNPNPHLASSGELAIAARQRGLSYPDLLEGILARALARPGR